MKISFKDFVKYLHLLWYLRHLNLKLLVSVYFGAESWRKGTHWKAFFMVCVWFLNSG